IELVEDVLAKHENVRRLATSESQPQLDLIILQRASRKLLEYDVDVRIRLLVGPLRPLVVLRLLRTHQEEKNSNGYAAVAGASFSAAAGHEQRQGERDARDLSPPEYRLPKRSIDDTHCTIPSGPSS